MKTLCNLFLILNCTRFLFELVRKKSEMNSFLNSSPHISYQLPFEND